MGADLGVLRRVTSRRARRWRHLQLGRLFRKLDERPGDRLFIVALVRIEPAKADQFAGHVRRNVEAYNHDALLSLLAPSARALGAKGQLPGPHRDFPHRFRVCLASASLRPGTSAGITRQIVERDGAGLDRPLQCCASHRPARPSLDNSWAPRNALIARRRRYAQCRAIGRRNGGRQSQLRRDRPADRLGANEARPACRLCCA